MTDIILFGGTAEGRRLADFLAYEHIDSIICVVSEHGRSLLPICENISIRCGKLPKEEMFDLFIKERPKLVIDATHPYASHISGTITDVCKELSIKQLSVHRAAVLPRSITSADDVTSFDTIDEMIDYINGQDVNCTIFSSLGAKACSSLTKIKGYKERVYIRILPVEDSLKEALSAGFSPKHIICMHGPFSKNINRAMFEEINASTLLTKESGLAGGFIEKIEAARELGMNILLLNRPLSTEGLSIDETIKEIRRILG